YLPADADAVLRLAKEKLPTAEVFELAQTRQGRSVKGVRFGAKPSEQHKPYGVWIQARQHAWEAGGSWVGQGFLQWAVSDEPSAVEFRKLANIYYIPIMDVDSVAVGAGGKDAVPRDHNRDWDEHPHYPEVAAAQKRIRQMEREQRFDVFIDLHNPGPNDRRPYFYGPHGMDKLPVIQQRNYTRWIAYAHNHIEQSNEKYRFATYVTTDEERNRMSANWVRNHTSSHVMSVTLETSWNRPEGTQKGYQTVGRQLGLSLLRYLESQPRLADDN
ncbi:M14 family zinc carboxypeptidase, partial [bacterium]|nr:M14 family zinc carboxypeptidase [bacterium]